MDKVKVYGKAQNRTALGIMHAYMVMYPHATMEDLQKAFPDSLNPDSGIKRNFVYPGDTSVPANWDGVFDKDDELLLTGEGKKVAVVKMWTKTSFNRLVEHARQYGIIVAQFEEAEKGWAKKGSFRLEYLNGYVPPVPEKRSKWWLWVILAAIVLLLAALMFLWKKPTVIEVEKVVTIVDTVYVQRIEEIEKDFNAAKFELGKVELNDDAKFVLHDLVKLMEKNTGLRLKIVGHASAEGDARINQQLSEQRAKAAVDFLISRGIAPDRLEYEGKGSSELIDENNPEKNRRTEFIVLE